jgi:hypothetical protein
LVDVSVATTVLEALIAPDAIVAVSLATVTWVV